jgi:uncharacterized protein (DUF427 family)
MSREVRIPGPDHPITVEPAKQHITVRAGDTLVAETDAALALTEASYPAVYYIPLTDVDQQLLRPTESHTYCPYKGEASYYSLAVPGADTDLTDAVWTYPAPYADVAEIAGHLAFYPDRVEVAVEG